MLYIISYPIYIYIYNSVTAEKVFLIGNEGKRNQLYRELELLKSSSNQDNSFCPYLIQLLDVYSNPYDGTLSMCLEYMNRGKLSINIILDCIDIYIYIYAIYNIFI